MDSWINPLFSQTRKVIGKCRLACPVITLEIIHGTNYLESLDDC